MQKRCYRQQAAMPRIRKGVFRALKGTPRLYCPSFMFEFSCVLSISLVFIEIPSEPLVIESNNPLKPLQILLIRIFASLQFWGAVSKSLTVNGEQLRIMKIYKVLFVQMCAYVGCGRTLGRGQSLEDQICGGWLLLALKT